MEQLTDSPVLYPAQGTPPPHPLDESQPPQPPGVLRRGVAVVKMGVVRFPSGRAEATRGHCPACGYDLFVGVVPNQSPQQRPVTQPLESFPPDVTLPCQVGDHAHCPGKVALPLLRDGQPFARCQCQKCNHPPIQPMKIKGARKR